MTKWTVVAMMGLAAVASSAGAAVYDYTTGGMDGSDWQLQIRDAGYWGAFYSVWASGTFQQFQNANADQQTDALRNRGAFVWTAPPGEYVTRIQFDWFHNAAPSQWTQVIYQINPGESLGAATPTVWEETAGAAYSSGSQTLNFSRSTRLLRLGLGFDNKALCYYMWSEKFSNVIITTAPLASVTGTLNPTNFAGDKTLLAARVYFQRPSDNDNFTLNAAIDASGTFTLANIPVGDYDVLVRVNGYLVAKLPGKTIAGPATDLGTINLVGGDSNGDNTVSFEDFSILQNAYGDSGAAATAPAASDALATLPCGSLGFVILATAMLGLSLVPAERRFVA